MTAKEKNCKWYFADQPKSQEVGPNNAMELNFSGTPYASLIRESIQNSMDAVLDRSKPVRMEFGFHEMKGVDYPEFFSIQEHIKGCLDYYPNNPNAKSVYGPMLEFFTDSKSHDQIGYISVSDFNTKGMEYEEGKTDSPFYAFVISAGVSAKDSGSAGGSYGFGKAAYFLISPISTVLVSTRTPEGSCYFEGVASLCTHTHRGIKKVAVGYYDDRNGLPTEQESDIPVRFRRTEAGTDIHIIGFDMSGKEDAKREMVEAVLRNFWLAVWNRKLEVEIDGISITKETLGELMNLYFDSEEDDTRGFSRINPRPYFDAVRYQGVRNNCVSYLADMPILGECAFYANKQKNAPDKILYMRSPLMLVYGKKAVGNYGVYGVFVCYGERGNDNLRSMENPAHTEWSERNWRIGKRQCPLARPTKQELEQFISEALNSVFASKDKKSLNIKGLEEFLYIPTSYDEDSELDGGTVKANPDSSPTDEGTSPITDISDCEEPSTGAASSGPTTGQVTVTKTTRARLSPDGDLRSGHTKKKVKRNGGIKFPGDEREGQQESTDGDNGVFSQPVVLPYRSFCQDEDGRCWHHVVLHSEEEIKRVRIRFSASGEIGREDLPIDASDSGTFSGNVLDNIHIEEGRTRLRIHFSDNMKHSLVLTAEKIDEH